QPSAALANTGAPMKTSSMATRTALKCSFIDLSGTNSNHLLQRRDEKLAVADLAGARRCLNPLGDALEQRLGDGHLDLELGQKIRHVLGAAIQLGMPLLPAEALDLGHRHALDPDVGKRLAHVVELERLDDGGDEFHGKLPGCLA